MMKQSARLMLVLVVIQAIRELQVDKIKLELVRHPTTNHPLQLHLHQLVQRPHLMLTPPRKTQKPLTMHLLLHLMLHQPLVP